MYLKLLHKFSTRYKINPLTQCWEWQGGKSVAGYGVWSFKKNKQLYAHRFSKELYEGEIPKGLVLDHVCRNTMCVNPDHLDIVTQKENIRRGLAPQGLEKFRKALSPEQVREKARKAGQASAKKRIEKTHCKYGHHFSYENTRITRKGGRKCKKCELIYQKNRREKAKCQ